MKGFLFFSWVLGLMACYHTYSIVVDMPGTESRLMSLEQAAQEDSSAIYVKGIVMDIDRNEPLSNAVIVFTKQSKGTVIGMITDSSGAFNRRLLPDVYTIEIKFSGKNTFRFQTDTLLAAHAYSFRIGLGDTPYSYNEIVRKRGSGKREQKKVQSNKRL